MNWSHKIKSVSLEHWILITILLFALFLRLYDLGNAPFWIDESISAIASQNILNKGLPIFDSGLFYSRALLFHYTQAFFIFFSHSEFAARLPSVIFGVLTVLLSYFIGREYSKNAGLLSALFVSVFYLEVFFSRQARFYQLFQLAFFLSLYLLYKSRSKPKLIYWALISLVIAYETQVAGLALTPFFVLFIWFYHKDKRYLVSLPILLVLYKVFSVFGFYSDSTSTALNFASSYLGYTDNWTYLLIFFLIGLIFGFRKNKLLTFSIVLPAIALLGGVLFVKLFALRYLYFFTLPVLIYTGVLFSSLIEKYGLIIWIAVIALVIIPSNLVFPYTYANVIKPINYNLNDITAPEINYKTIPPSLLAELRNGTIVTFFSPPVEWYIKKPDYVIPFSMDGRGNDSISYNGVDVYSGASIFNQKPEGNYYVIASYFAAFKLGNTARESFDAMITNCTIAYDKDFRVYRCNN